MSYDATEDHMSDDVGFVLAVGSDEKLLRRLNDLDYAETCSTSKKGTDARWKLEPKEVLKTLWNFAKTQ
jgi:trehalose 6-phosphate synthase/phosphatase